MYIIPHSNNLIERLVVINFYNIKDNMYFISDLGRVFNIITGKEVSQSPSSGYRTVALQTNTNERKTFNVHRLVAIGFIPKTYEDIALGRDIVNHKNLNRSNNFYLNLEWVTYEENNNHAMSNNAILQDYSNESTRGWGSGDKTYGENNGMSRLIEEQVHIICMGLVQNKSYFDCALMAGLEGNENDRFLISHIAQGVRWKYISCKYNIPPTRSLKDFSPYITPVCEMISDGKSTTEIADSLDLPYERNHVRSFINRIKRKKTYTDISNDYDW